MSADHTLTPVNSNPTAIDSASPKGKKSELMASHQEHERAALEHVGADSDLAMGSPRRIRIEKRLKLKLDARMSILVYVVLTIGNEC